ncbi:LacI family DNA-binding transcriptional regulator [Cellulomonas sp. IC4_254]|uniref:LacI family DNA-binding transcriptional regulator n=1 Tax=Cellulomonas sp. IC4_254 TaxID=2714040 RepID=UPI001422C1EC|nr:LacI family DNA-binding transcriptional regulator [Cellulomonas sp. IC4_254]NHT17421.1 LacI family transcriptional regulator [Cellulomonas sp. IC4_254]
MSTTDRRPTLEQVAAAAGVSTSTASKVLNGRPGISPGTRRRVEEAIDRLGYAPTTGPRAGTAPLGVAVVFRTLADVYALRVLEGVVASAREHGVEVVVDVLDAGPADGDAAPLSPAWTRRQAVGDRAGVVLVTTQPTDAQRDLLRALAVPTVHIDPVNPLDDSTVSVGSTNFSGGVQATRHLLELGHRRIAFAGGAPTFLPSAERLQGYLSMMRAGDGQVDEALVRSRAHTFEAGLAIGDELLELPEPPTAVFAASDSIALGVLASAQRHGLRVPQDLSVVGFDDSSAAASSAPPLTTVRQPVVEMGRVALRTLLQLARGERVDSHHVQLSTALVVRESTAPPAAG